MALTKVCKSTVQSQLFSFYRISLVYLYKIVSDFDPTHLLCVQLHI